MDSADVVVGGKPAIKNAVVSSANIKNGDFITVIWRCRAAALVDNTYCKVLSCSDYRIMEAGCQREKGILDASEITIK